METEKNTEVGWHRCSRVSIDGDALTWELSEKRRYNILEAYGEAHPHRELMAASSNDALRVFVRKWGPLRASLGEHTGTDSVQWYCNVRDLLTATVRLMDAIEEPANLRPALLELIRLREFELNPLGLFLQSNRLGEPILDDPEEWCRSTPIGELERLCVQFVNDFPLAWIPRFVVQKHGRVHVVRTGPFINSLFEGLWWMVWQDRFRDAPFSFCGNCGKFILREGQREWKFCDQACAKQKADRESWRRNHGKNIRYRKGVEYGSL